LDCGSILPFDPCACAFGGLQFIQAICRTQRTFARKCRAASGFSLPELVWALAFVSVVGRPGGALILVVDEMRAIVDPFSSGAQLGADFLCMFVGAQAANVLLSIMCRGALVRSWPELNRAPAFVHVAGCSSSDLLLVVDEVPGIVHPFSAGAQLDFDFCACLWVLKQRTSYC
jgi:hypothetical protein